jgi:hypothetical protein
MVCPAGVGERRVPVALAGEDRAGVAAVHGGDDDGTLRSCSGGRALTLPTN